MVGSPLTASAWNAYAPIDESARLFWLQIRVGARRFQFPFTQETTMVGPPVDNTQASADPWWLHRR